MSHYFKATVHQRDKTGKQKKSKILWNKMGALSNI
uniref:Uncharacterized protein n=1 Tax=Anguilla anguilla TaxID=7936 RepID=A0A0E9TG18_ANGAN